MKYEEHHFGDGVGRAEVQEVEGMILGIHHVQVTVARADEAAAREFYMGVLGLPEIEKPERLKSRGGFWVRVGAQAVHIGVEEGVNRWQTKAHIAYEVAELAQWRERLTAAGIDILESIPIAGWERFEFRDPFGNRVELIQEVADAV